MHELSLVMGIVDIAEKEATKAGLTKVEEIEVDIGKLTTVEMGAFDFAWKQGVRDSVLADAVIKINRIDAKAKCLECSAQFELQQFFDACPQCGSHFLDIINGREFRVKTLTFAD
ncbi:MAG: hydrogenase maturation nickel metallochaperone HypA [Saprospiraceae bacterium]|nr:hydrogenase maturation nickel metallochaperone HypA [Saprospiraceae bacterium]